MLATWQTLRAHWQARRAEPPVKPEMIAHRPSLSLPTGMPLDLPHGATGANGHAGVDPDPSAEDEQELIVVRA